MKLSDTVKNELIYDYAAWGTIVQKWPQAKFEWAKDDIHPDRISITIPGVSYNDFYIHALDKGYCEVSLSFQFLLLAIDKHPDFESLINKWLADHPPKRN